MDRLDKAEDAVVMVSFTTNLREGERGDFDTAIEVADIKIVKNLAGTLSVKTSTNGLTLNANYSSTTGYHVLMVDTSVDTGDTGFWETGMDWDAVLYPDETLDGKLVTAIIGQFSIENGYMRGTDSAALASVCTEGRLAELDAANLPADVDAIKVKTDNLPSGVQKNTALANFEFVMIDASDHATPLAGLTVTAVRTTDGAAFAACAHSVSAVSDGVYKINLATSDLNGDVITLKFTAAL